MKNYIIHILCLFFLCSNLLHAEDDSTLVFDRELFIKNTRELLLKKIEKNNELASQGRWQEMDFVINPCPDATYFKMNRGFITNANNTKTFTGDCYETKVIDDFNKRLIAINSKANSFKNYLLVIDYIPLNPELNDFTYMKIKEIFDDSNQKLNTYAEQASKQSYSLASEIAKPLFEDPEAKLALHSFVKFGIYAPSNTTNNLIKYDYYIPQFSSFCFDSPLQRENYENQLTKQIEKTNFGSVRNQARVSLFLDVLVETKKEIENCIDFANKFDSIGNNFDRPSQMTGHRELAKPNAEYQPYMDNLNKLLSNIASYSSCLDIETKFKKIKEICEINTNLSYDEQKIITSLIKYTPAKDVGLLFKKLTESQTKNNLKPHILSLLYNNVSNHTGGDSIKDELINAYIHLTAAAIKNPSNEFIEVTKIKELEGDKIMDKTIMWGKDYTWALMDNTQTGEWKYEVSLNANGKIVLDRRICTKVTEQNVTSYNGTVGTSFMIVLPEYEELPSLELSPFELVVFHKTDKSVDVLPKETLDKGVVVMPAICLLYANDTRYWNNVWKATAITADVVTLFAAAPVGLTLKTISTARRAWALAETAGALGNLAINTQTNNDPNFKTFVDTYNLVMVGIGIKNVAFSLKNYYNVAKNNDIDVIDLKLKLDNLITTYDNLDNTKKSTYKLVYEWAKRLRNTLQNYKISPSLYSGVFGIVPQLTRKNVSDDVLKIIKNKFSNAEDEAQALQSLLSAIKKNDLGVDDLNKNTNNILTNWLDNYANLLKGNHTGTEKLLIVGEGTFEYSRILLDNLKTQNKLGTPYSLTATGIENQKEVFDLIQLKKLDTDLQEIPFSQPNFWVQHNVDATQLQNKFGNQKFDKIIFNNPRAGDDFDKVIKTEELIENVLNNAPDVLKANGEIHFGIIGSDNALGSQKLKEYFREYNNGNKNIQVNGKSFSVVLKEKSEYPFSVNYRNRTTDGTGIRNSFGGPSKYYIFKLQ